MTVRDVDWTHIKVVGDRKVAATFVPFARKLLGYTKEQAQFANLKVNKVTKRADDGTVVTAEIHGSIPRITIDTTETERKPIEWLEGFVLSTGYSDVKPVILEPTGRDGWTAYTGYAFAFPITQRLIAGGLDASMGAPYLRGAGVSHENDDGEVVSWYHSGSSRYFYQEMVEPRFMFDRFVTHRGRVLFNAVEYAARYGFGGDKPHVLGAAVKDKWLYLVSANMNYDVEYTVPDTAEYHGQLYVVPQWVNGTQDFTVWRVALVTRQNGQTGALEYFATGQYEVLFSGSAHNAHGPWCFSKDAKHVVMHAHPDEARYIWKAIPNYPALPTYPVDVITPSVNHKRHYIALPEGVLATTDATDVVAEDSGVELKLVRIDSTTWVYEFKGQQYPAYNAVFGTSWELDYADLANGWLCMVGADRGELDKFFVRLIGPSTDKKIKLLDTGNDPYNESIQFANLDELTVDGLAMMSLRFGGPTTGGADAINYAYGNPGEPDHGGVVGMVARGTSLARTGDYENVNYGAFMYDDEAYPISADYLQFLKGAMAAATYVPGTAYPVALRKHITARRQPKRSLAGGSTKDNVVFMAPGNYNNHYGVMIVSNRADASRVYEKAFPDKYAYSIYPLGKPPKGQPTLFF